MHFFLAGRLGEHGLEVRPDTQVGGAVVGRRRQALVERVSERRLGRAIVERGPKHGPRIDDNDLPASEHGAAVAGCDHDGGAVGEVRPASWDEIDLTTGGCGPCRPGG